MTTVVCSQFARGKFKYILLLCGFTILVLLTKILENRLETNNFKVFPLDDAGSTAMTSHQDNIYKNHRQSNNAATKRESESIEDALLGTEKRGKDHDDDEDDSDDDSELPTIYAITPTYKRFLQKAELTRVSQTFRHVKNFHWILVEDSKEKTSLVRNFLAGCGLPYTHLNIRTPKELRVSRKQPRWAKSRGIEQRNLGLSWLREHIDPNTTRGVVYFADDDNTYDVRIFDEMRSISGVGIWPVAFTGAARWSGPICKDGLVLGFHNNWKPWRKFPIDMAGFAINLRALLVDYPGAKFEKHVRPGLMETSFLEQITTRDEMEPRADNCKKVYVWHTRTETPIININGERQLIKKGRPSNPLIET